jgi:hypothetical protein
MEGHEHVELSIRKELLLMMLIEQQFQGERWGLVSEKK